MNIAMIVMGNPYRTPYIKKYASLVKASDEFTVLFWNRDGRSDKSSWQTRSFNYKLTDNSPQKKMMGYLHYRKFLFEQIDRNKYDLLIVSPTNAALLLSDVLIKRFSGRYVIDVRDYCHERLPLIRWTEKKLVAHAAQTVISSDGYRAFLPADGNYLVVHNVQSVEKAELKRRRAAREKRIPARLGCVGSIVYYSAYEALINQFKDEERFTLSFIGHGSEVLEQYCTKHGINNVVIQGAFPPEETTSKFSQIDIVNGIYGANHPSLDYALSNKLYLAAELGIPIVANKNTYMEKIARKYGIGIGINWMNKESIDELFDYYMNLDYEVFDKNCDEFLQVVEEDNAKFEEVISALYEGNRIEGD